MLSIQYMLQTILTEVKNEITTEDKALSPVIGIVFIIAIILILLSVVGIQLSVSDAPDDATSTSGELFIIQHEGGDTISTSSIHLIIRNKNGNDINKDMNFTDFSQTERMSVSDSVTIFDANNQITPGTKLNIRIIHRPSDSTLLNTTVTVD
jgi:FlaG/FlaF family flagellin (archaellin)